MAKTFRDKTLRRSRKILVVKAIFVLVETFNKFEITSNERLRAILFLQLRTKGVKLLGEGKWRVKIEPVFPTVVFLTEGFFRSFFSSS